MTWFRLRWNIEGLRVCFGLSDRRRIDFLIAGAQKGGTTALDNYLRDHPEICMARRKEVHFFDDDKLFGNPKLSYVEYHAYFHPDKSHKIIGEATPIYMYWKPAPQRIWQYNPNMKIIIILRNPIQRAYSHWYMEQGRNNDSVGFWEAIQTEPKRLLESSPYQHRIFSYIDRGFYLEQLKRIWKYFPKHQSLILLNDDLKENPKGTLDKVCNFLGVSCLKRVEPRDVFSANYHSVMTDREREYLRNIFSAEIRELGQVLGRDLSHWN